MQHAATLKYNLYKLLLIISVILKNFKPCEPKPLSEIQAMIDAIKKFEKLQESFSAMTM